MLMYEHCNALSKTAMLPILQVSLFFPLMQKHSITMLASLFLYLVLMTWLPTQQNISMFILHKIFSWTASQDESLFTTKIWLLLYWFSCFILFMIIHTTKFNSESQPLRKVTVLVYIYPQWEWPSWSADDDHKPNLISYRTILWISLRLWYRCFVVDKHFP